MITAAEWEPVKRGLAQRVRALNAFVADVYGDQRIVAEGVVPPEVIRSADYFEPEMRGITPPSGVWIGVAGLDIVRDANGEWLVLEDNVRTPSGFAYLHATRRALLEHIDVPPDATPRPLDGEIDLLADALRAAAPESARGRRAPLAARAHRRRAQLGLLGARLALAPARHPARASRRELELRGRSPVAAPARAARGPPDRRHLPPHERRPPGLRPRPAADRARPRAACSGSSTSTAPASPTTSSRTPTSRTMIRFYLGEEPVLRSVPTYDLAQPGQLEEALDVFDELVLKPRAGHGGVGVLIAPRAYARRRSRPRAPR